MGEFASLEEDMLHVFEEVQRVKEKYGISCHHRTYYCGYKELGSRYRMVWKFMADCKR